LARLQDRLARELLGQTDIADDTSEAGDEPGRLDPPDGVDERGDQVGYPSGG